MDGCDGGFEWVNRSEQGGRRHHARNQSDGARYLNLGSAPQRLFDQTGAMEEDVNGAIATN